MTEAVMTIGEPATTGTLVGSPVDVTTPSLPPAGSSCGTSGGPAGVALLEKLRAEREPSLAQLMRERDPSFYTLMGQIFERKYAALLRERDDVA